MGILENQEGNLIKDTCKSLGLTYKELGEKVGYGESIIRTSASKNQVSKQLQRAIELYNETIQLKYEITSTQQLKDLLNTFLSK